MMDETRKAALRRWYGQEWVLQAVKKAHAAGDWEEVETCVHRTVLLPLSKHHALPDYMREENGAPLFPKNLNPLQDYESWSEAVRVGWSVMEENLGITMDAVQDKIRAEQDAEWKRFMDSVEERKKKRGEGGRPSLP